MHGKHPIPATGFSIGMERLVEHLYQHPIEATTQMLWISLSTKAKEESITLCNTLKQHLPSIQVHNEFSDNKLKSQLQKAHKRGYSHVVICGDDELKTKTYQLKNMLTQEQNSMSIEQIIEYFKKNPSAIDAAG